MIARRTLGVLFAALAVALGGCGVSVNAGGGSETDNFARESSISSSQTAAHAGTKLELEGMIDNELPGQIEAKLHQPVYVSRLGCTEAGPGQFACLATVGSSSATGGSLIHERLSIGATCDADSCLWRVTP